MLFLFGEEAHREELLRSPGIPGNTVGSTKTMAAACPTLAATKLYLLCVCYRTRDVTAPHCSESPNLHEALAKVALLVLHRSVQFALILPIPP